MFRQKRLQMHTFSFNKWPKIHNLNRKATQVKLTGMSSKPWAMSCNPKLSLITAESMPWTCGGRSSGLRKASLRTPAEPPSSPRIWLAKPARPWLPIPSWLWRPGQDCCWLVDCDWCMEFMLKGSLRWAYGSLDWGYDIGWYGGGK